MSTSKQQLDTKFALKLSGDFDTFLLEVDRKYNLTAHAEATSKAFAGGNNRIRKRTVDDGEQPHQHGGGG
jgi:hypothetical protein